MNSRTFDPEMRRTNCNPFAEEGPTCVGDFGPFPERRQAIRPCPGCSDSRPCPPQQVLCPCAITRPILAVLCNEEYGLKEIKDEVRIIENTVLNANFGLQAIDAEVEIVRNSVLAQSVKLDNIDAKLTLMETQLLQIMAKLGI